MTTADDRLLCAWCGKPLNAVEAVLHSRPEVGQRWGWHVFCEAIDPVADRPAAFPWHERRAVLEARGPGRVGTIVEEEK